MLKGRNLIAPTDFTMEEIRELLSLADRIIADPAAFGEKCKGKVLASLFYEPSTRTKSSFDAAILRLGGSTLGFSDANTSSVAKGETVADTAKTVSQYADLIVVRHPKEGTARLMSKYADCPVINAGDGGHMHPTQTLGDLLTIHSLMGGLDGLTVGLCGDLMFGRTVHSLVTCLSRCTGMRFVFISPRELRVPVYVKEALERRGLPYVETEDLEGSMPELDILYMTRVQRERFVSEEEYLRLKDFFILTEEKMRLAKEKMIVMHPLPRVTEISTDVDADPRAAYFVQMKMGMYMRMALILSLLGVE